MFGSPLSKYKTAFHGKPAENQIDSRCAIGFLQNELLLRLSVNDTTDDTICTGAEDLAVDLFDGLCVLLHFVDQIVG
jgi:hypothetical protein